MTNNLISLDSVAKKSPFFNCIRTLKNKISTKDSVFTQDDNNDITNKNVDEPKEINYDDFDSNASTETNNNQQETKSFWQKIKDKWNNFWNKNTSNSNNNVQNADETKDKGYDDIVDSVSKDFVDTNSDNF